MNSAPARRASLSAARSSPPADSLLARLGNPAAGSRIAVASVEAIRNLGLEVVPDPKDYDAGHAEIRSGKADLSSQAIRKQLAKLFTFRPETEA